MRKRIGLVVLFLIGVLLITLGATSVFAQEPVVSDGESWEEMHQACENGDDEAMAQWHAQRHDAAGGMMGDGMMGNGMTDNITAEMMSGCGGSDGMMGGGSGGMMGNGTMGGGSGGMMGNGMMGGGSGGMMGNGTMGGGSGGMMGNGMMGSGSGGMMGNGMMGSGSGGMMGNW